MIMAKKILSGWAESFASAGIGNVCPSRQLGCIYYTKLLLGGTYVSAFGKDHNHDGFTEDFFGKP